MNMGALKQVNITGSAKCHISANHIHLVHILEERSSLAGTAMVSSKEDIARMRAGDDFRDEG